MKKIEMNLLLVPFLERAIWVEVSEGKSELFSGSEGFTVWCNGYNALPAYEAHLQHKMDGLIQDLHLSIRQLFFQALSNDLILARDRIQALVGTEDLKDELIVCSYIQYYPEQAEALRPFRKEICRTALSFLKVRRRFLKQLLQLFENFIAFGTSFHANTSQETSDRIVSWSGTETDLVELVDGLYQSKIITSKSEKSKEEVFREFFRFFDLEVKNHAVLLHKLKNRKKRTSSIWSKLVMNED